MYTVEEKISSNFLFFGLQIFISAITVRFLLGIYYFLKTPLYLEHFLFQCVISVEIDRFIKRGTVDCLGYRLRSIVIMSSILSNTLNKQIF